MRHPIDPVVKQFGSNVRELRCERNMSLRELSRRTGIAFSHLSEVERGQKDVSLTYALRISRAFGLPLGWFVDVVTLTDRDRSYIDAMIDLLGERVRPMQGGAA